MVTDLRAQCDPALILDSVSDGIHGIDMDGRIIFENLAAQRMFGYPEAEMLGKYAHALVHHTHADGTAYPVEKCPIYACLQDGQERTVGKEVFWRRDGVSFPVEYKVTPIVDHNDDLCGALVTFRDISQRKRLQKEVHKKNKALKESLRAFKGKSKQLASLLDNANQGFLSFDQSLIIDPEYSRACVEILGLVPAGEDASGVLFGEDPRLAELLREIVPAVLTQADRQRRDVMLTLLPREFRRNDRLLQARYSVLENEHIMVALTDVTEEHKLAEKVELEHRRLQLIVAAVTESREFFDAIETFRAFSQNKLNALIAAPGTPAALLQDIYRKVHTFKSSFDQFSFEQMPHALHELESRLAALRAHGGTLTRTELSDVARSVPFAELLDADLAVIRNSLGEAFLDRGATVSFSATQVKQLDALIHRLRHGIAVDPAIDSIRQMVDQLARLLQIPLVDALSSFDRVLQQTAAREGKQVAPLLVLGGGDLLVHPEAFRPFLRSLVHVFRNAVAHGIEQPETRRAAGKDVVGKVVCTVHADADTIQISIDDDGAGIDIDAIRRKALNLALYTEAEIAKMLDQDLLELIFLDNFSTREDADAVAGRGVGLAAVRGEARALGGDVAVCTTASLGTQIVFTLPRQDEIIATL